jgi:DsbC/DsbD-like thiol-disulfide interchange protein
MGTMQERPCHALILSTLAAGGLFTFAAMPAFAANSSPWDVDTRSAVRLVAARSQVESGINFMRAGVEMRMQPGWKTYWRYPGDSGVPPVFDFGGSENVKTVTVLWPAPERFSDGSGNSIGYKDMVVLPLRIVPKDDRKPVTLRLKLDYAVCETLCVPAKGAVELQLSGGDGASNEILNSAEARVPKPTPIGAGQSLIIRSVQRMLGALRARVVVDIATPPQSKVDLFAEGPTPKWALPLPEPLPGSGAPTGLQRFGFDIDGLPPGATPDGATLKLTAVSKAGQAIEVEYRLE